VCNVAGCAGLAVAATATPDHVRTVTMTIHYALRPGCRSPGETVRFVVTNRIR
jgi:hypothetical protein